MFPLISSWILRGSYGEPVGQCRGGAVLIKPIISRLLYVTTSGINLYIHILIECEVEWHVIKYFNMIQEDGWKLHTIYTVQYSKVYAVVH